MNFITPFSMTTIICFSLILGFMSYFCCKTAQRDDVGDGTEVMCGIGCVLFGIASVVFGVAAMHVIADAVSKLS